MRVREPAYELDLLARRLHGLGAGQRARHEDRPELSGDATGREPREVCLHGGFPADQVDRTEVVAAVVAERPGQVVVSVDDTDGGAGGHRGRVTGVLGRDSGIQSVNRSAR